MTPFAILLFLSLAAQQPARSAAWGPREAEHLLNRAAFGASTAQVERAVERGQEAAVDELLDVDAWFEEPYYARKRSDAELGRMFKDLPVEEKNRRMNQLREADREQLADFLEWWVARMLDAQQPLRERMVLFWHGHFTSSMDAVKSSYEMIQQNQLFRRLALGSFRDLLHAVARDPAMLLYLDNAASKKAHPNENFARELMELFTLGEGNYGEQDVREVARAFTGWTQKNGRFQFDARSHDNGSKSVLGVEGNLGGDDVLDILLEQPACARYLAGRLLTFFEGCEPSTERRERYAGVLRGSDYRIDAFLRALFLDAEFYRPEACASRVTSPVDYLVGAARRLGVDADPRAVVAGCGLLGQRLFFPPSVRGWEGGEAWATSTSLLLRGELAGLLLGRVRGQDLARAAQESFAERAPSDSEPPAMMDDGTGPPMQEAVQPEPPGPRRVRLAPELRTLGRLETHPRLNLTQRLARASQAGDDALARALVEELLAIPAPAALIARVSERLAAARAALPELGSEPFSDHPDVAEPLLRELAHGLLALPEAQLD